MSEAHGKRAIPREEASGTFARGDPCGERIRQGHSISYHFAPKDLRIQPSLKSP